MLKFKSWLGWATALLFLLGWAVWLNRPAAVVSDEQASALLPDFKAQSGNVDTVLITQKNQVLQLERKDGQWRLRERHYYPANNAKVAELLKKLSDAQISEIKTADPSRYERLGVNDGGDKSQLLSLSSGGNVVTNLVIGNSVFRPAGTYVRRVGEAQSYLINQELSVGREVRDWLKTELLNLPAATLSRVERVQVSPFIQCVKAPCESVQFSLSRAEGSQSFMLDKLPINREMQEAHVVSGLTDFLNGLTFNDVRAESAMDLAKVNVISTRFSSADQQVLVHYLKRDEKHYVALQLTAVDGASEDVKKTVADKRAFLDGWWFEISSYKAEGLSRQQADLTRAKTK